MKDRTSLRAYLKDFQDYMITHHGLKIVDTHDKSGVPLPRDTILENRSAPVKIKTGLR